MSKLLKLLLGLTLGLIALVVVLAGGALLFFDPNAHKDFIISKLEAATGRKVDITGTIQLTYYPWLGLQAEGITLGNAAGFADVPFLQADHVAFRIKTMPLLRKQYELDTFRLHGLELNLAKNKDGVTNWADLSKAPEQKKSQDPLPFAAVVLGGVDVKDAQISWLDETTDQHIHISGLNATTGELTYGAPINLDAVFKAEANRPALNADVKLKGVLNYDLDSEIYALKPLDMLAKLSGKGVPGGSADLVFKAAVESNLNADTVQLTDLLLEMLGTRIQGTLNLANVSSGQPQLDAQLSVQGDDLARLLQVVDGDAAKQLAQVKDRTVDMKANLTANIEQGHVNLSQLEARLLGANIQGQMEASQIQSDTPSAKGSLKATGPDLPALMQVLGQFETGPEPKLRHYAQRLAKVDNKNFDIAAEFDADLGNGTLLIPTFSVNTFGITANGQMDGKSMNTASPKVDGKFSLKGEKLADVLAALDQKALGDVLQTINVDAGVSGKEGDIAFTPLQLKAVFAGKQIPNSPAELTLAANTRINPGKDTLLVENLSLQGLGVDVRGNLSGEKISTGKPAVKGTLDAKGSDLALLFKLAGIEPLAGQLAALDTRSFDIKAGMEANLAQEHIKLSNLDAKLLGASITGQVEASQIQSDKPSAKGTLKATGPDLPALMQVIGQFETGKDPKFKTYGQRLAKAADRAFDVSAEFDANPAAGQIRIPTLAAKALGITVNGQLDAKEMNTNNGSMNGKLAIRGEKLADVLSAFGQSGLGEVMQSLLIDAGVSGTGGDIALTPLQVKATFAGKQIPNSPVDLTLNANSRINLDKQTLALDNLSLKGLGLDITSNLNATGIQDKPAYTGDLSVREFNLRQFAQQLNLTLPATADKNVFNKVAVKTGLSGTTDSLNLKDFAMQLDESKINGNLSIQQFSQPDLQFGIVVDSINADRYLPPAPPQEKTDGQGKTAAPATPETAAAAAATELPLDTLRALRMNGDLQIGHLVISNAKLSNIKLALKANEGDIRLEPALAELYQGKYQGTVHLNAKGKVPKIVVNSQLTNVSLDPLLKDYLQEKESPLAGIADISLSDLTGMGVNVRQLKRSLTGTGKLLVNNGILRGVDVNKTLEQVEIMIESKIPAKLDSGGETPFEKLTATLDINKGIVTNKDMLLTAPGFKVTGQGMLANLNNETIKYDMLVSVDETTTARGESHYNIGGYDIPVKCRGKLSPPDCKPDAGDIAKVLFKKTGEEKIQELLKDTLGVEEAAPATVNPQSAQPATTQPKTTTTTKKAASKKKKAAAKPKSEEELLKDAVESIFD